MEMELAERKQRLRAGLGAIGEGDPVLFTSLLDEGAQWTISGSNSLSGTYDGLSDFERVIGRLGTALEGLQSLTVDTLIAEGDYVVCQCRGESKTKAGQDYNNTYCFVFKWSADKIIGVTEYLDTELVTAS